MSFFFSVPLLLLFVNTCCAALPWQQVPPVASSSQGPGARYGMSCASSTGANVTDTRMVTFGGQSASFTFHNDVHVFFPWNLTWIALPTTSAPIDLPSPRSYSAFAALSADTSPSSLPGQRFFLYGGTNAAGAALSDVYILRLTVPFLSTQLTAVWSKVLSTSSSVAPSGLIGASAVLVGMSVYLIGGQMASKGYSSDVYVFLTDSHGWRRMTSAPQPGRAHAAVARHGRDLFVVGGASLLGALSDIWVLPYSSDVWVRLDVATPSVIGPRWGATLQPYAGNLFLVGGTNGSVLYSDAHDLFVTVTGVASAPALLRNFPAPRSGACSALLDDVIYVVGGTVDGTFGRVATFSPMRLFHSPAPANLACPALNSSKDLVVTSSAAAVQAFVPGARLSFSCLRGELSGARSIICQTSFTWTAERPLCMLPTATPDPIVFPPQAPFAGVGVCPMPRSPTYGRVSVTGLGIGDTAIFACDATFTLVGSAKATCSAIHGLFLPESPYCVCKSAQCRDACSMPMPPQYGTVSISSSPIAVGTSATYNCHTGFNISRNTVAVCRGDGNWSVSAPLCGRNVCPGVPTVTNAIASSLANCVGTSSGDRCTTWQCESGLTASAALFCTEYGTWQSPGPVCGKKCYNPPTIDGVDTSFCDGTLGGTACTFSCRGQSSDLPCSINGTWGDIEPDCSGNSNRSGLVGILIGGIIGVVLLTALVAVAIGVWLWHRRRAKRKYYANSDIEYPSRRSSIYSDR